MQISQNAWFHTKQQIRIQKTRNSNVKSWSRITQQKAIFIGPKWQSMICSLSFVWAATLNDNSSWGLCVLRINSSCGWWCWRSRTAVCRWALCRRRGTALAGWWPLFPPERPAWRSTGTDGPAPWPRTSSPLSPERCQVAAQAVGHQILHLRVWFIFFFLVKRPERTIQFRPQIHSPRVEQMFCVHGPSKIALVESTLHVENWNFLLKSNIHLPIKVSVFNLNSFNLFMELWGEGGILRAERSVRIKADDECGRTRSDSSLSLVCSAMNLTQKQDRWRSAVQRVWWGPCSWEGPT